MEIAWLHMEAFVLSSVFSILLAGRRRFGMAPTYVALGLMLVMVWLGGMVDVPVTGGLASRYGSVVFLPLLLAPIVAIYVLEGTSEARRFLVGLVLGSFLLIGLRALLDSRVDFFQLAEGACAAAGQGEDCRVALARDLRDTWEFRGLASFASSMGVLVGGVAIVVVYQAIMNAFPRLYFLPAFLVALYTGLASDAVLYGGLLGLPFDDFAGQFTGKMTVGVVVALPLSGYVALQVRRWPEHVRHGVLERSAFDIVRLTQELRLVSGNLDRRVAEYAHMRDSLARFVTNGAVDRIVAEAEVFHSAGEAKELTLVKVDVRGFSTLTANMAPEQAEAFLTSYQQVMSKTVSKAGGVVAEEDGDSLLIVFEDHGRAGEHATRALACVDAMLATVEQHNERLDKEGISRLYRESGVRSVRLRVGVHSGGAVVGDVGEPPEHQFVVVGEPVGVVRRVEEEAKRLKAEVLVSRTTVEHLGERASRVVTRGEHQLRGTHAPLELFEYTMTNEG